MWNEDYLPSPHSSLCSLSYRNEDMYMRAGYSRPVLVLSTLFSEEESIFRNMDKFSFFLLLMVLEYKDFKISQWHVIYALFAEAVTRCFSLPHYQNTWTSLFINNLLSSTFRFQRLILDPGTAWALLEAVGGVYCHTWGLQILVLLAPFPEDGKIAVVKTLLLMAVRTESLSCSGCRAWTVPSLPDPSKFGLGRSLWRNVTT